MIRPWRVGIGAMLVLALGAGIALAADDPSVLFPECGRTPPLTDVDAAKLAHRAAAQLFERSEYDRAIENWRDAYKLDCTAHGVLLNAASAYEKKGDKESAIAVLQAYLKRAPSAPDATAIVQKIDTLKSMLPPPTIDAGTDAEADAETDAGSRVVTPLPPLLKPQRPYGMRPWYVVGVGGVAVFTGVLLVPIGLGAIAEAEDACGGSRSCKKSQADAASDGNTGRAEVIAGDIALGVGIAAIAGGLVWQFALNKPRLMKTTEDAPEPAPPVSFGPMIGPDFGGVSVTGAF